jgi:hypothetical protein
LACSKCVAVLGAFKEVVLEVVGDELDDISVDVCDDAEMDFLFQRILSPDNANINGIFMLL